MQGVIKSYDPVTRDGSLVRDTDLAEFDLAILLKREGLPKDEIPKRLKAMSAAEKDILWASGSYQQLPCGPWMA